ncbi:hypothetical protein ACVWZK_008550 [Bradyrhizobium sp. GM0.4]
MQKTVFTTAANWRMEIVVGKACRAIVDAGLDMTGLDCAHLPFCRISSIWPRFSQPFVRCYILRPKRKQLLCITRGSVMTNQNAGDGSFCGLSRRSLLQSSAALLSLPLVAQITSAWAQEKLAGSGEVVAFTWGGSYTEGVRRYVFEPFKQATGIKVVEAVGDLPVPLVKAMYHAGRVDWDIAYLPRKNYPEMHEAGMFVPIDYSLWDQESLDGTPPEARLKDAVYIDHNSEVLAYDPRAFPDGGPQTWVDFWDVKKFPGPRGLYAPRGQNNIRYGAYRLRLH